jgi:hypothetical protein
MNTNTIRNGELATLAAMLQEQHVRKIDLVVPGRRLRSEEGTFVIEGAEAQITLDGVTRTDGRYEPTPVFDEGVASKLNIPLAYLRRMRQDRPDLYDANVNGWLEQDTRSFLLRGFRGDDGGDGVGRALLSDKFRIFDNIDAIIAMQEGLESAGVAVEATSCDLTDRRMTIKIKAPELQVLAPELLRGYRSPFTGAMGDENPVIFGGLVISNSETGGGAFTITPRLVVQVCNNGMTITKDALRAVHLGGKLDAGVINWSEDTTQKTAAAIAAKTRDAVRTFLDVDYMTRVVRAMEQQAGKPVEDAVATVKEVGKRLAYSEEQAKGVLDFFIKGGQLTAGGIVNAVTAYSQTVEDADEAYDLEASALRVLQVV